MGRRWEQEGLQAARLCLLQVTFCAPLVRECEGLGERLRVCGCSVSGLLGTEL